MDWEEARRLVDVAVRPDWDGTKGVFYVAPEGKEDRWGYLVSTGTEEAPEKAKPTHLVVKSSGAVKPASELSADRRKAMTKVGSPA